MKKRKMSKKFKIILTIIIVLVAAVSGVGAYFITEANKAPAEIEDSEAKFKTTLKEVPNDGKLPTEHEAIDVIAYILWRVENTDSFKVITTGKADASVTTQLISNERIVKDKTAMVSTISSGMVSLAKQKYYSNNKVLLRDYEKLDGIKATWKTDVPECISYEEMISRYGWLPFQANGYIICEETYLNKDDIKVVSLGNDLYRVAFDLNPESDYAPFWYRREILTNSGSTIIPEFLSIHAEFTFDKDYKLIYQDFKEAYKVKAMGVSAETKTDVRDEFTYDNVEFNSEYLDYFNKYKDLTPKVFTGEEPVIKADVMTMLVSSLQNGNNDVLFDLGLKINGNEINGNVLLNISDLENVKVKAKLDELEVEYLDNNLYVALANLKLKGSINDITDLISGFVEVDNNSLDVNEILKAINGANVVEDGNNKNIKCSLDLMGINIDLDLNIIEDNDDYTFKDGNVKVKLDNNDIELNLTKGNTQINSKDYSDYNKISNLSFIVDFIKNVIDNKSLGINGTLSYDKLNITIDGGISFNGNLDINANILLKYEDIEIPVSLVFRDNYLYVDIYNIHLKASILDIMKLINIDSINTSLNINDVIEKVFSINYSNLIERFVLDENVLDLDINLKELSANLDKLNLEIKKNDNINIGLIYDKLMANLSIVDYHDNSNINNEYVSFASISYLIDDVIAITKSNKVNAKVSAKYNDMDIALDCYIDFSDNVKVKANASVSGIDLTLYYFSNNNTLYVEYDTFNGYLCIDDIISELDINNSFSLNDILSIISKINIENVIKYLKNNNGVTSLGLDLSTFDVKDIIDLSEIVNIDIKNNDNGFNVKIDKIFDLNIDVLTSFDGDIELNNNDYIDMSKLVNNIINILKIVNKESFRLDINAELDISNIVSLISKKIELSGYVDFIYDDKYSIVLDIDIKYSNISCKLGVIYSNDYVYINVLGLNIKLEVNKIEDLINEVFEKLEIENTLSLDDNIIDKVFDIVKEFDVLEENKISIDLSSLFDKLGVIIVKFLDSEILKADIESDLVDLSIEVKKIDKYDITYSDNYILSNDILKLVGIAKTVMDIAKKKEFNISLDLSVYDSGLKHLGINGSLKFKIYDNGKFDMEASGIITQYENSDTKYHILDLRLISHEYFENIGVDSEDMVYITYGTILNSDSQIKIYLPLSKLLGMAGTISEVLGVDFSFLDGYSSFNFKDIDTTQVKNLISSNIENKNIILDNIIKSLVISDNKLSVDLDISDILPQDDGSNVSLVLDTNKENNSIARVSLNNLYTVYRSVSDNTMLDIDLISLIDEEVNIEKPNLSGYYDLSSIDNLVNGLLTTATFKDFEISGSAKMKMNILGLNLDVITLPFEVKVKVDEDGKPTIYAHLDLDSTLAGIVFDAKYTDIYFKDDYVYIYRKDRNTLIFFEGSEYRLKVKKQTFLDNIVDYLLVFGMGAKSIVTDNIGDSSDSNSHVIDASKVLNSYSATESEYALSLSLYELTGNSMLGDVSLKLGLNNVNINGENVLALTEIKNLDVSLLGFIDLNIASISLKNINDGIVGNVDLSNLESFISNYSYPLDEMYEDNTKKETISHTVTFVLGLGKDNIEKTGKYGDQLTYPSVDVISYNGNDYKFVGWYKDKELTEEFDLDTIPDDNMKAYAKYVRL